MPASADNQRRPQRGEEKTPQISGILVSLSHRNNFNLLRMIAASSVIVAHAYGLQKTGGIPPIGGYAVDVFFSMSGFLIMGSLDKSGDVIRYFRNRLLRIYPGLIVCTIVTVLVLAAFSTVPAQNYFTSRETISYLARNSTLVGIAHYLPGVFETLPYPKAVNGSLWTLRFEMYCYIVVGISFACGLLKRGNTRWVAFAAALTAYAIVFAFQMRHGGQIGGSGGIDRFERLGFCFLLGMIYSSIFDKFRLKLWHVAAAIALAALLWNTPLRQFSISIALASCAFWIAYLDLPWVKGMQTGPDYSYGTYIYAFPIQQIFFTLGVFVYPLLEALLVFAAVLPIAALSWHFVESPALRLKDAKFWGNIGRAKNPTS